MWIYKTVYKRDIFDLIVRIIDLYDFCHYDEGGLEVLRDKLEKFKYANYNLLGRTVFMVEDLNSLINKIKLNYDGDVNQGPQPWRGQSDYLSYTIHSIDTDFRRSMNRHNQYHVNKGTIPRNSLIGRSKFSYQNIHLNLGKVRWYYTEDKEGGLIRKTKSIKNYSKPVIKDNNSVYSEIADYIKNSPINKDTQLKIENTLLDYSYITLNENLSKKDKPLINYNFINSKFTK